MTERIDILPPCDPELPAYSEAFEAHSRDQAIKEQAERDVKEAAAREVALAHEEALEWNELIDNAAKAEADEIAPPFLREGPLTNSPRHAADTPLPPLIRAVSQQLLETIRTARTSRPDGSTEDSPVDDTEGLNPNKRRSISNAKFVRTIAASDLFARRGIDDIEPTNGSEQSPKSPTANDSTPRVSRLKGNIFGATMLAKATFVPAHIPTTPPKKF